MQQSELENIFKAIVGDVTPSGTKDGVREIRTSVYGDSKEQLDSIALCYIRLLRNNFVPITNNPMFVGYTAQKKKNDTPEDDQQQRVHDWLEFDVDVKLAEMSRAYDKKLQEKIYERIKAYAPKYEQEALKKMF